MSDTGSSAETYDWNGRPNLGSIDDSTLNKAFDLLRNQRRRYALIALYTASDTVLTTEEIVDRVLMRDPDAVDRDHVRIELRHLILPHLADKGVIEYDTSTNTVRYRGSELVDSLLVALSESSVPPT